MAELVEYVVAREHRGDRITDDGVVQHDFVAGEKRLADPAVEKRLADPAVVKHLVGTVLVDPAAEKADPPVKNKAEGNAPANKSTKKED